MNAQQLKCQDNPVSFIQAAFNEKLWSYQKQVVNSVRDFKVTAVKSSNGIGKSYCAARTALWFLYSYPNSKVITTAPTFRQVEDILWRELRNAKSKAIVPLTGRLNKTSLDLSEEWFAIGLSTNEPDRFQGYHAEHILLVVDEAAGVDEQIFIASDGIVTSDGARVLYIGNPTNLGGTFYKSFRSEGVNKITVSAFDTPNFTKFGITLNDIRNGTWQEKIDDILPAPYLITPEWVADKFTKWGEGTPMWSARVLGEFPEQGEDTLIPLIYIEKAVNRILEPNPEDSEQIGADIARFGVDKTVFMCRKGPKVIAVEEYSQGDTMKTAQDLHVFAGFHPAAQIYIDEIGVGAGALDRLKQIEEKHLVQGVNVGMPSQDPEMFINLRAEIYWALRERFLEGNIQIPNDDELMAQLANIKFKYTNKGQIQIEAKEEMKKRGLPSPDKADSLSLAFGHFEGNQQAANFLQGLGSWT